MDSPCYGVFGIVLYGTDFRGLSTVSNATFFLNTCFIRPYDILEGTTDVSLGPLQALCTVWNAYELTVRSSASSPS